MRKDPQGYTVMLHVFLQSGKLVMKMFQKIQELIDDKEALVCVLIDEVHVIKPPLDMLLTDVMNLSLITG